MLSPPLSAAATSPTLLAPLPPLSLQTQSRSPCATRKVSTARATAAHLCRLAAAKSTSAAARVTPACPTARPPTPRACPGMPRRQPTTRRARTRIAYAARSLPAPTTAPAGSKTLCAMAGRVPGRRRPRRSARSTSAAAPTGEMGGAAGAGSHGVQSSAARLLCAPAPGLTSSSPQTSSTDSPLLLRYYCWRPSTDLLGVCLALPPNCGQKGARCCPPGESVCRAGAPRL